jgi:hypothetical protein
MLSSSVVILHEINKTKKPPSFRIRVGEGNPGVHTDTGGTIGKPVKMTGFDRQFWN